MLAKEWLVRNPFGQIQEKGLYRPYFEHDNCGVGFVARIDGAPSHQIVQDAITVLVNLEHRGALGSDQATGDGAGLLIDLPDRFFWCVCRDSGIHLPERGDYGIGMLFLPRDRKAGERCTQTCEKIVEDESCEVIGWRDVPLSPKALGDLARETMPRIVQLFVARGSHGADSFERKLYVIRRRIEREIDAYNNEEYGEFYIVSLSSRSVNYKGFMNGTDLPGFYPDLTADDFSSRYAVVHQRYSTNTFPSWHLAQPFRFCAHNGEINTLSGNRNHMLSRQRELASKLFDDDIDKITPVIMPGGSDSASFDNVLELLVMGGRSLPHAMMMMIPEAWGNKYLMGEDKRAFYEYHASFMEPWDGPAAMVFADGRYIGGVLDRNGLRPARYTITRDGIVVLASEDGVIEVPGDNIRTRGRLQPGKMFLVDLEQNRVVPDNVIKARISRQKPYRHWVRNNRIELRGLLAPTEIPADEPVELRKKLRAFGYTEEDLKRIIAPMAARGQEPVGSMGDDTPLAVLSNRPQLLFNYFKQLFAQVTNPPIDPLREELVMSLMRFSGKERNLLEETPEHCRQLKMHHPILTPGDMQRLRSAQNPDLRSGEVDILFPAGGDGKVLKKALDDCFAKAESYLDDGVSFIILTDRAMDRNNAPIPVLLAASGLHHYLIKKGKRSNVSIVVETGEAREIMHFALLIGYGASAICPYVAFSTIHQLCQHNRYEGLTNPNFAADAYVTAIKKGLMKTMSRIGISTIRSYFGAQIFEAVGLSQELVDAYFCGTVSRIGGISLDEIARETRERFMGAFDGQTLAELPLQWGGIYQSRKTSEKHLWSPEAIATLQQALRTGNYELFKKYTAIINDQDSERITLRSLLRFKKAEPVPIDEVEPVESIVRRFATSAMSMGSLSKEAHETLAIGMNRIGGRSNSGEGGEDAKRFTPDKDGTNRNSAIKQVASGRFGVTIDYLSSAEELQIKVAQGAKPGEGGQLPGHKVTREIAEIRHSTPGVTLISPPPHHDIYSIEDLAQLIFDLKTANPRARVSVKLVSEAGVGTVAAGVVKGKADTVVVSGFDGGTGASPLTSIRYAGLPWELGLAETQQTLVANNLREQVRVHVDGQLRTGRDLAIAAMLGADEFGFGTISLVALGCVLLRKCHLNACSVGVATQDPALRAHFRGKPEYVENLMRFLAEDLREHMAASGFRTLDDMIGRVDMLEMKPDVDHYKAQHLVLAPVLCVPEPRDGSKLHNTFEGPVSIELNDLQKSILQAAEPTLKEGKSVKASFAIRNIHRTIGTYISGEIARHYGTKGLPDDTVHFDFTGTAGQSFGAFLSRGVTLRIEGTVNDYLAKGMTGGRIIVVPPANATFDPGENVIAGNVVMYGATGGEVYLHGIAGERFAVRNSGAVAVVEGVGDHGCEYMTGGIVVVLGDTGNNFAAGMSGGIAFVFNDSEMFETRCNMDMVDIESVTTVDDEMLLKGLIERYHEYTGSRRAAEILGEWGSNLPLFAKVMPIDYKQSLLRVQYEEDTDNESISATEEVFLPPYMEHKRKDPPKRSVEERVNDYREIERLLPTHEVEIQASRCRDCGVPFCHNYACPVHNSIPDWNILVANKQWRQALDTLQRTNNFPEITGRVCPALCEASCTLSINMPPVTIKHIELQIVERGWSNGWITPQPAHERTGRSVAVIGSGPAGLTVAQECARLGHEVTVFERDDSIGGMLRYGIPDFKLEKWIIDRRLDQMREEGVIFETGVHVGVDLSAGYLMRSHNAVVLTTGAREPRDIDAPGRDLDGIHFAMDFLSQQNSINSGAIIDESRRLDAGGKRIIVLGGGDTGSDCVGTSHRHKAKSIHQIEILPKPGDDRPIDNPWPEWPVIMRESSSHQEGCERIWGVLAKEFIGIDGKLSAVRFAKIEWEKKNGRMSFREVPGSEFEIEADMVLIAAGFVHVEHSKLLTELGIEYSVSGNVDVDSRYMSTIPGVFAAGDSVMGASLVVRAMSQGKNAAAAVHDYLTKLKEKQTA